MLEAEIVNKQRQKFVQKLIYREKLSKEPKYWFLEKMQLVNGFDPYSQNSGLVFQKNDSIDSPTEQVGHS